MKMEVGIRDLATSTFRTTRKADEICADLTARLGWRHRYVAARLALGRSLSLPDQPPELTDDESEDMAIALRGMQLFGEDVNVAAWLALITQHSNSQKLTKRVLQGLVTRHWRRGAILLKQDWQDCGQHMEGFVARLAELACFVGEEQVEDVSGTFSPTPVFREEVRLPVGEVAMDLKSQEQVTFSLNGAGGSPHMAIIGAAGSGKSRTAVHMLRELRQHCKIPLLAFDFKGDLSESFVQEFGAKLIAPPLEAVPLDVLHVESVDDTSIKTAAARIRDSLAAIKQQKPSGAQSEALREAIQSVLRRKSASTQPTLVQVASALESEYADRGRKTDELTATLNELTQFELFKPKFSPREFYSMSWIIRLPQDSSTEMRRLVINLTLDALDRWINSQPDAPTDDKGIRALRHFTMLDEAHIILSSRLPALRNLVRMSRSKGGSIMLISQSPDDFEAADDGYLDNMGLTLAFNTQAKPGPTKRIFGNTARLTGLQVGEALCRIRSEAKTQQILCWRSSAS